MSFAKIRPVPESCAMNAVIYARYSSEKQTENSIDFQLRAGHTYCEAKGFKVVGEYIDRAISGTSDSRPEFQRMITDAKKQCFAFIIVYRFDRFSRNRYDSAIYKKQLELCGVRVLSTEESIGNGDESIILESIYEAMAESYSRRLSRIVTQGMRETAMKGLSTGGKIPFGLKVVDRMIAIDEDSAPAIRYLFEARADGIPKKPIADELNKRGYRTKKGCLFTHNSVAKLLSNPMYKGIHNYAGIERTCPAIVSTELWDRANEIEKKEKKKYGKRVTGLIYALSGKLFCGDCGAAMVGDMGTSKSGKSYAYYTCAKRKKNRSCAKKSEKQDFIEWYVCEQTILLLTDKNIKLIAKKVYEAQLKDNSIEKKIEDLKKQIASIDRELDAAAESLIKTNSTSIIKRINEKVEGLEERRNIFEVELSEVELAKGLTLGIPEIEAYLSQFKNGDPLDENFRHRLIKTLINCVYLFDDKLIIYYNVGNTKEISYIDVLSSMEELNDSTPSTCSNSLTIGPPKNKLSEHRRIVYMRGGFGQLLFFDKNESKRAPPVR